MLTRNQRDETIQKWRDTPAAGYVLAKCAAGLAIVAGLALAGTLSDAPTPPSVQRAAAGGALDRSSATDARDGGASPVEPSVQRVSTPDRPAVSE